MKKIMRIMCAIVICIVACFSFIACNLVKLDPSLALNQEIIKVDYNGKTKNFTRNDLLTAYKYYGYKYYQSTGDLKSAINQTINSMVRRSLLIEYIEENEIDITNYNGIDYTNEVRYRVYEVMKENLDDIEEEVRKDFDKEVTLPENTESTPLRTAKTEYSPKVELIYLDEDTPKVVRVEGEKKEVHTNIPATFELYYEQYVSVDEQVSGEVWSRYIKSLQATAKSEGRSTDKADVLDYTQQQLEKVYKENVLLELFEEKVLEETEVNTDAVVDYYKEHYLAEYNLYSQSIDDYHSHIQNTTSELIYYHPEENNDGYILVQHILINLNESSDKIDELNEKVENSSEYDINGNGNPYDDEYYITCYNNIIENTIVKYEIDGETKTAKIYDVLNNIKNYVNDGNTPKEKLQRFDEMMYIYNDDSGNVNNDFYYRVYSTDNDADGYNPDTDATNEPNSFNEYFADASREFLVDENEYNIGDIYVGGDYQGLVIANYSNEYSAHIIIYGGRESNICSYNNIDKLTYSDLCNRTVNPASEKTVFQYIYDILFDDDSIFEARTESIINTIVSSEGYKVYCDEYKYKDIWG